MLIKINLDKNCEDIMKNEIKKSMINLVNKISEVNLYTSWDESFKVKEIQESLDEFNKEIINYIDLNNLTQEEAKELGFKKYSEDKPNLWLIPLYLTPLLQEGFKVISIDGEEKIIGKDYIDDDSRYGCISYGIEI